MCILLRASPEHFAQVVGALHEALVLNNLQGGGGGWQMCVEIER